MSKMQQLLFNRKLSHRAVSLPSACLVNVAEPYPSLRSWFLSLSCFSDGLSIVVSIFSFCLLMMPVIVHPAISLSSTSLVNTCRAFMPCYTAVIPFAYPLFPCVPSAYPLFPYVDGGFQKTISLSLRGMGRIVGHGGSDVLCSWNFGPHLKNGTGEDNEGALALANAIEKAL
ncbi:Hypothetical predicted protein [Prunus dulcis]|uniref:Uncharacterized protein n=1 Tax=Prunus dulcis TaxID=3755 RepID=A0A5E4FKD8_PRUDU|nr:Hypothetical predicted protein [Prunus dulcis]